jgi:hypothetical protein
MDIYRCPTCLSLLDDPHRGRCPACGQNLRRRRARVLGDDAWSDRTVLPVDRVMLERVRELSPPVAQPTSDRRSSVPDAETAPPTHASVPAEDAAEMQAPTVDVLGLDVYTRDRRHD